MYHEFKDKNSQQGLKTILCSLEQPLNLRHTINLISNRKEIPDTYLEDRTNETRGITLVI